jgi:hypothetical protein
MPDTLRRLVFAAAIAGAAMPAWGAGMPDFGTKNFSPGGDAPSYFSNENRGVSTIAGESWDDGEDATARSEAADVGEPGHTARHYRGGYAATHRAEYRSAGYARLGGYAGTVSARVTGRSVRAERYATASTTGSRHHSSRAAVYGVKSVRHAWVRLSSRGG